MQPIARAKPSLVAFCLLSAMVLPAAAFASDPAPQHDHTHAASSHSSQSNSAAPMAALHDMRAMHEKIMSAKTPAERRALMADHLKAMQKGMSAMQQMGSCCGGKDSSKSMAMRMDMMTMMMQMMMDRQRMKAGMGMDRMMSHPPKAHGQRPPPAPKP